MNAANRNSRLGGLHRLTVTQRIERLREAGFLDAAQSALLASEGFLLQPATADRMIENVVGVFGLPFAVVTNLQVNGRDYLVPMVVEEPSIVAAASAACSLARRSGGFHVEAGESLLIGQVELREIADIAAARVALHGSTPSLLEAANAVHPNLRQRGGGVTALEVRDGANPDSLLVHWLVDTCDAMGANLVNTICEAMAPQLERVCAARAGLKILSNYADRSLVRATVSIPEANLAWSGCSGAQVRDAIVAADRLARIDAYRAVTHNKGIMNGIDPVALATGNDWRAIEAGAHAHAARSGNYRGLTEWRCGDDGALQGMLEIPLKPGIVGAAMRTNPGVVLALEILAVRSAGELAAVMAAIGLAQNFAAIRALGTEGIQRGHMRLHARSVVAAAGVALEHASEVTERLVASGEIKEWKAREIYAGHTAAACADTPCASAAGKIILAGEHAVVYSRHALALPLPDAMTARIASGGRGRRLRIPSWHVDLDIDEALDAPAAAIIRLLADGLGLPQEPFTIEIDARFPHGVGLGASASLAVVSVRALAAHFGVELSIEQENDLAYRAEQLTHGTPSGVDNSVACFGKALLYRRGDPPMMREVVPHHDLHLLVCVSSSTSSTAEMVGRVRDLYQRRPGVVEPILTSIDAIVLEIDAALRSGDLSTVGGLMNANHGLLAALGLSTPEIERLRGIANAAGALGVKVTGAGGGGAIVALAELASVSAVEAALRASGLPVYGVTIPGGSKS